MQTSTLRILLIGLVWTLWMTLSGCAGSHNDPGAIKAAKAANLDQQLKAIDDNPHMPPGVKASVKASIIQHQNANFGLGRK